MDPQAADECGWEPLGPIYYITPRQYRIVWFTANGYDLKDMAQLFGTTPQTIKVQRSGIYRLMQISKGSILDLILAWNRGQFSLKEPVFRPTPTPKASPKERVAAPLLLRATPRRRQLPVSNDKWDEKFKQFVDPEYYGGIIVRHNSPLSGL